MLDFGESPAWICENVRPRDLARALRQEGFSDNAVFKADFVLVNLVTLAIAHGNVAKLHDLQEVCGYLQGYLYKARGKTRYDERLQTYMELLEVARISVLNERKDQLVTV